MAIGYACQTLAVPKTDLKHCLLKNADESTLLQVGAYNLEHLKNAITYAISQGIQIFRISSDIIPFASKSEIKFPWESRFSEKLNLIGKLINSGGLRVSMHPGQYTVLNSPHPAVVENSIADLAYHTKFLDSLSLGSNHKVILHIGGIYGDKSEATKRFCQQYRQLDQTIKNRLVLENDDKNYTIAQVLDIAKETGAPVVFDNLHHELNPSPLLRTDAQWIAECKKTWKSQDGRQKIHYSQQDSEKKKGSHSATISLDPFLDYVSKLEIQDLDIMLEVKDKNISALKCMYCLYPPQDKSILWREWERYRYLVSERNLFSIFEIQDLLGVQDNTTSVTFYRMLENILRQEPEREQSITTAKELFNLFADQTTAQEKTRFQRALHRYREAEISLPSLKKQIKNLCEKYSVEEVTTSYYFQ
ncbi:UV damage endonuclease UvdE [Sphaerochaeta pleomorpha str. Grapes]|uniref:UV damage endonuclease UvdE n=1 Tax=Sphaerochaeta pleomorpha (strain ATCC BAA-1885 / DSM 22778 / Grapes) TaxID=158190 RepID=G8QQ89_SPHPG|nr:UV DNA damage repair endonuclease UvsE [Sphaerochaeta pleomorpha]AEV28666.1 UV damage endonuclease UvdE [Sphaerochaeta pleomorpha str. Grapes]